MEPCVKVIGADFELSNAVELPDSRYGSVGKAARMLLDEIPGLPLQNSWGGTAIEWGRRFLVSNGGSAYIDSDHLEINLPEHTRARDHAAIVHAGLRIAQEAQKAASAKLPDGGRINVTAAVSDGQQSWGHHLNVMVRRELFDDLFTRKPHLAGFVATHLATATLYTGQGQAGAGNSQATCDYQLSQRADWFEELIGEQTMRHRPLLNARDEPHAGEGLARLHLIFFDRVLCPTANYLMAGATQLVLAMAEAGWADSALLLDDPLDAAHEVSRDLTLRKPLPMARRGKRWTAVEVQQALADLAGEFVASGQAHAVVPGAEEIVACWQQTLDLLRRRELTALARRCDWALKYLFLERQCARKGLTWTSAEMRTLDLRYSSLNVQEGLFWQMAAAGLVEDMPTPECVQRFYREPPDDTRAYLRAHVLRQFGELVSEVDWSYVGFRLAADRFWWSQTVLSMPDPTRHGRTEAELLLAQCPTLPQLIEAVGSEAPPARPEYWGPGWSRNAWHPPRHGGSGAFESSECSWW